MAEELTDSKLSKIKVGCMSSFLGREARDKERIFICGGMFVQLYKGKHMFRYMYRDENKKLKQITIGLFALNGNSSSTFTIEQAKSKYLSEISERNVNGSDPYKTRKQKRLEREEEEEEAKRKALLFKNYWPVWVNKQNYGSKQHLKKVISEFEKLCSSMKICHYVT